VYSFIFADLIVILDFFVKLNEYCTVYIQKKTISIKVNGGKKLLFHNVMTINTYENQWIDSNEED